LDRREEKEERENQQSTSENPIAGSGDVVDRGRTPYILRAEVGMDPFLQSVISYSE
jgi:hypothetical protein